MTNAEFILQNSSSYTHEYSQFPNKLITIHNFKDADNSVAALINTIDDLKFRCLYESAAKVISENADKLAPYTLDSSTINTLEEENRNAQVMALQKHQCVYFDENEPDICAVGDVWEGGT